MTSPEANLYCLSMYSYWLAERQVAGEGEGERRGGREGEGVSRKGGEGGEQGGRGSRQDRRRTN